MQPILYNTVSKAVSDYFVAKILCFLLQCSHTAIVWGLFWKPVERITARNLPWDQSWDQSWSGTRRGSLLTTSGWGGNDGFTRWAEQIVLWWEEILSSVCFVSDTIWESFMAALIYCPMKQINGEEMNWAAAKILQWLANWELGTATQRRWMWVLQLWWWSLSCKL